MPPTSGMTFLVDVFVANAFLFCVGGELLWCCTFRYRSTMEKMSSVAERLRSLQLDEEESQRLQLMRRTEERRITPSTHGDHLASNESLIELVFVLDLSPLLPTHGITRAIPSIFLLNICIAIERSCCPTMQPMRRSVESDVRVTCLKVVYTRAQGQQGIRIQNELQISLQWQAVAPAVVLQLISN